MPVVTAEMLLRRLIAHWDKYGPAGGFTALMDEARTALRERDLREAMQKAVAEAMEREKK